MLKCWWIVAAGIMVASSAPAEELPENVRELVKTTWPGGSVVSVQKEGDVDKGRIGTEYEIKVKLSDGRMVGMEIGVAADGSIRETTTEEVIPLDKLPGAVVEALGIACPGGKITACEKQTDPEGNGVQYETRVKLKTGRTVDADVIASSSGRIMRVEVAEPVEVKDLPKTVGDAAGLVCPGGRIGGSEKETVMEKGEVRLRYETKMRFDDGRTVEVEVETAIDGSVTEAKSEEIIAVKDLPGAIVDAVTAMRPKGTIVSAEKETELEKGEVGIEYKVRTKLEDGTVVEVGIETDANGRIIEVEIGDKEDDGEE